MAKSINQKLKLLYMVRYLSEHSDDSHFVSTKDIISYLDTHNISAERKSIYDDIAQLQDFGYDIVKADTPRGGYALVSRDFQLAEVKLLVDLVQSSKFITSKKSTELIKKLETLASHNEAVQLQRQVVVSNRNKTINESIYYSVDMLYKAMAENVKVRYQYFEWDVNKHMALRKNGEYYEVSPWLLTWDNENYYLLAYDDASQIIKHYRVDKMLNLSLSTEARTGRKSFEAIDVAALSNQTFGMFAGETRTVQLLCHKSMTSILIDRFGTGIALRTYDEDHVLARINIQISPQFYGWITGLGNRVVIHAPSDVAGAYQEYLQDILQKYAQK